LWDSRDTFDSLLADWPDKYDVNSRTQVIESLANELRLGIARSDAIGETDDVLADADIINAGWIARSELNGMPIDQLVEKSLESMDFLRRWTANGGKLNVIERGEPELTSVGMLSGTAIRQRLTEVNLDKRLVISPVGLSSIHGASIDVRLGKHFIVFERSSTPALSAAFGGARRMQSAVEKSWDDYFVLHPGELVLASTLEYLVLPADLVATVITRSSYGRLGLLTATAVLVHPWYKGCLTLELINLGRVPLELQPGERIAQLAFQLTGPPSEGPDEHEKYRCNTKPEFSRVALDDETSILRAISRHQLDE
jgi:deoxycytidine triphosphate deaminase